MLSFCFARKAGDSRQQITQVAIDDVHVPAPENLVERLHILFFRFHAASQDAQMVEWGVSHARECGWWDGYTFSKAIAEMMVQDVMQEQSLANPGRRNLQKFQFDSLKATFKPPTPKKKS